MVELPTGTVTFLFTDIEGSTQLLKRLGDRYADVLAEHQRIVREACAARGGREIDTQGDSFFYAFPRANAAIGAAVVTQRALAEHLWPDGVEVRVRMGLHTGEPLVGENRYVGMGVHRAARIGAAGHGGQMLLSNATRELVEDDSGGVSIRELGLYRLKDIDRPERLYQLDVEGLRTQFPPLRAEQVDARRPVSRRRLLVPALVGVIAAAVAIPIFAIAQGGSDRDTIEAALGNSVAVVDTRANRIVDDVEVGTAPANVAVGEEAIWATNAASASVDRIDPRTSTVRQTIRVGRGPDDIALGAGSVWVGNGLDGSVSRIDPDANEETQRIPVGAGPAGIAFGLGAVWVVTRDDHKLVRIDPASGDAVRTTKVGNLPADVAVADGALWVTSSADGRALRVDPATGDVVEEVNVGRGPGAIAVGAGSIWVANTIDGTVSRIDPERGAVTATIRVGEGPSGIVVAADGVWVSSEHDSALWRIDPATGDATRAVDLGARPAGLALDGSRVYAAVRPSGAAHRGGTLTFLDYFVGPRTLDPVSFEAWRIVQLTNDGLTTFRRRGGSEGAKVVPNLATAIPRPTNDGRTYTFRLRPGIRYSNGVPLRASDFRRSFERVFERGEEFGMYFLEALAGAERCKRRQARCDLSSSVVTDDDARTVTLHLARPDPELPSKLAFTFLVAVPRDTPSKVGTRPVPATGPYVVAGFVPGRQVRLVRNPRFREWTPARPAGYADEIVIRFQVPERQTIAAVTRGEADATAIPQVVAGTLDMGRLRATSGERLRSNPTQGQFSVMLDTEEPPFDDVRVRRAVHLAIDREAVVRAVGGPEWASPSCQVLPPNYPGHEPFCPYEPNLARARRLVTAAGEQGTEVVLLAREYLRPITAPVLAAFQAIGLRPRARYVEDVDYLSTLFRGEADAGLWGWIADYPSASTWIRPQFACGAHPYGFCDRALDRAMDAAERLGATDPSAAHAAWARIDRTITMHAPFVPLFVAQLPYLVSERVGNYQYSPVYELLLEQVWVR